MAAQTEEEKEVAVTKLYVMLQQRIMWARNIISEAPDGLSEILDINMPDFLRHLANIILRKDKQQSDHVGFWEIRLFSATPMEHEILPFESLCQIE